LKKKQAQTTDSIPKKVADFGYKSINELDSIQKHGGKKYRCDTEYWFLKKWLTVKEENTNEQIVKSSLNHLQIIYRNYCLCICQFSPLFYGFSR
jgi:hypothetical protein